MGQPICHTVSENDNGYTLRHILRNRMFVSRHLMRSLKQGGDILLNGQSSYLSTQVKTGDIASIHLPTFEQNIVPPEPMDLNILLETQDYLFINKPPAQTVHPVKSQPTGTLANGVSQYYIDQGHTRKFRPGGRLDRDTSGVILVSKSRYAQSYISRLHLTQGMTKEYLALVEGTFECSSGQIDAPISRDTVEGFKRKIDPKGKPALTLYHVLEKTENMSLVQIQLITGRTHQIRVHMAYLGHPIIGDTMYGQTSPWIDRQALHCHRLAFSDLHQPDLMLDVRCDLPKDMRLAIEKAKTVNNQS